MPRQPRKYLPGFPTHVVQRGVNREPCFFGDQDRAHYLRSLAMACDEYRIALHAYVLMSNHVHLLMTPEDTMGISRALQSLGSRYVQFVNRRIGRTGTLWEDRHHGTVVDTDRYLLTCYRYVELNPVRAHLTDRPEDHLWSSYRSNGCGEIDPLLTPHETYLGLGATPAERLKRYRALFEEALPVREVNALRTATHYGTPFGSVEFCRRIDAELGTHASTDEEVVTVGPGNHRSSRSHCE